VKLVLASASPRRRELLGLLGLEFEVVPAGVAEISAGDPPVIVVENALRKARAVAGSRSGAVVLGVDTDVVCDGRLLGKPGDDGDATARLRALAGRTHEVLSGIALIAGGREESDLVRTAVTFRDLDTARSRPTSPPANGGTGPGVMRCRDSARRSSSGSRAICRT